MAGLKRKLHVESDIHAFHKELDEVSCAICMECPHNAVLLICSSHEKGCRSYICDTSYRHSNCLDRFRKLKGNSSCNSTPTGSLSSNTHDSTNTSGLNLALRTDLNEASDILNLGEGNGASSVGLTRAAGHNRMQEHRRHLESRGISGSGQLQERAVVNGLGPEKLNLTCPLCRGNVRGWEVVQEAREYLNMKKRSCSRESCTFSGNYQELRRHARRVHPSSRPADIDPSRERAWRRIEHQREYGDIVSAIRSAIPGALVVGDYVIENGNRLSAERETGPDHAGPWWTTFFLFQMIGSVDGASEPRPRARAWPRHRRSSGALSERRYVWGENLLGLQDDDDEDDDDRNIHILSDLDEDAPLPRRSTSPNPRRRRRLTRSSDEDQQ